MHSCGCAINLATYRYHQQICTRQDEYLAKLKERMLKESKSEAVIPNLMDMDIEETFIKVVPPTPTVSMEQESSLIQPLMEHKNRKRKQPTENNLRNSPLSSPENPKFRPRTGKIKETLV